MSEISRYQMQYSLYQLISKLMGSYLLENNPSGKYKNLTNPEAGGKAVSFANMIQSASKRYDVDPDLVKAVVQAESGFDSQAVSMAGAQGLMQIMPDTARELGVKNSLDPKQNIDGGVRYLGQLLDQYDGSVELALAAYNAGPGSVNQYGGIPPYQETQVYVDRVMKNYQMFNEKRK